MAAVFPIPVTSGITHTVFVDNSGNLLNASCAEYVNADGASLIQLRQMAPQSQITSLDGRIIGNTLNFTRFTLFDYEMRRKAETLQHTKNKMGVSKKQHFSSLSNSPAGSYQYSSKMVMDKLKSNLDCPNMDTIIRPPTNSGIRDYKYPGYYYDINVPYFPGL